MQIINLKTKCFSACKIRKGVDLYLIHSVCSCFVNGNEHYHQNNLTPLQLWCMKKCTLNCLALNEMQKPHFNTVRVVAQTDKNIKLKLR
jgi:hypothetical protein